MFRSDQQISIVERSMVIPRLADFPATTAEKPCLADTDRNGHISNTVFAVCQTPRVELLCDDALACHCEIVTRVERRSSATLARVLFVDERCIATAESVVALMDMAMHRSAAERDRGGVELDAQAQLRLLPPAATSPVLLR